MTQVLAGLVVVIVGLVAVAITGSSRSVPARSAGPAASGADHLRGRAIGSMFQDDPHLIYASTAAVTRTLDILKSLGANQIRATVVWKGVAPEPLSPSAPRHFNGADPADYPAAAWLPYDRLDELAHARGMTLNFNVTAPAPRWAVAQGAPSPHYADHWRPSAARFGSFVQALGTRYSGRYIPPGSHRPLPRVSFWSIWNEPNQPGWLAPQWRLAPGGPAPSGPVMEAPVLYRGYVDAAFAALVRTGHSPSTDTVLAGDLAPEGCVAGVRCIYPRPEWPSPPLPFLRALYCLGPDYQPLSGGAAAALSCPASPDRRTFVSTHPGLFQMTGLAHHPYSFFLPPNAGMSTAAFAPLANLGRLEQTIDAIFRAYGVGRRLPIYLTEYGYETNPPNPYRGVRPALQALYLNEAQYMAWRDPRVRTLNQFLLYDYPPNRAFPRGSPGYWSTFQTGLLYADGRPKPALSAYRLPLFLPRTSGPGVAVWAMLRDAPPGTTQQAVIQWRRSSAGPFRTIERAPVHGPSEVLSTSVRVPGPGELRVQWTSPAGQVQDSRTASVR